MLRRAGIALSLTMMGLFSAPQAAQAALSDTCALINSDLGSALNLTNTAHEEYQYQGLSAGEVVTWTFSTTGTANEGSSSAVVIYSNNDNDMLVDESNLDGNKSISDSFTASASVNDLHIILDVTQGNSAAASDYNTLTFSATCAASTSASLPTVTAVSPTSGTTAGGTTLTITGTDFTGATAVTIGGQAATSYTVNSATQITAVTPAGTAGAKNVSVTTSSGSGTLTSAYTYVTPTITFSPTAGALTGATVGTSYSQTVAASSGTSPYSYAVTSG
ncbi:IPT/TIG domain-containing protein, partial [Allorhizobium undicola]|uniref:IPT/TIG domain-containing protein n=1 Tax=Allorhizobium undicola TaxID=78527 RepID=UPI001FD9D6F0